MPIEDVAPAKWTRQSTAMEEAAAAFALPTQPEVAPWWEIDLGKSFAIEEITLWIEPIGPTTRVRVSAYAMTDPAGAPPNGCFTREIAREDLRVAPDGSQVVTLWDEVVARYVRIELLSPDMPSRLALADRKSKWLPMVKRLRPQDRSGHNAQSTIHPLSTKVSSCKRGAPRVPRLAPRT